MSLDGIAGIGYDDLKTWVININPSTFYNL